MPRFRVISLTVAGGHNDLYLWNSDFQFQKLGTTIDDAAGEAFDKGARMLGLHYPGGPALAQLAEIGNPHVVEFPRPMKDSGDYMFSFSGLKTALLYELKKNGGIQNLSGQQKADMAASYQEAIGDTLIAKLFTAVDEYGAAEVHLAGGVSANLRLREKFLTEATRRNVKTRIPEKMEYCTDNAAMIAAAGYGMWKIRKSCDFNFKNVQVNLSHEFRF
jgi:N6-L-threonylcarbamoyladenine synthase